MNSQRIDDLVDVLGDNFSKSENVFVVRNQLELFRFVNDPEQWKAKQLANMVKYRTEVLKMAKDEAEKVARQVRKVYLLAYKEIDGDNIEITKTEVKGKMKINIKNRIGTKVVISAKMTLMADISAIKAMFCSGVSYFRKMFMNSF